MEQYREHLEDMLSIDETEISRFDLLECRKELLDKEFIKTLSIETTLRLCGISGEMVEELRKSENGK